MLKESGFDVEAIAFHRDYHNGRLPDCQVKRLGHIDQGNYLARCGTISRALPEIRRAIHRCDLVYAAGPDIALACKVAGIGLGKPIVLEIGDVRELQVAQGLKGRFIRRVERFLVDRCSLLVVTAPDFLEVYYRQWLQTRTAGIVLENKVEPTVAAEMRTRAVPKKREHGEPLRIGLFGVLRSEWVWRALQATATAFPDKIHIIFAGLPSGTFKDIAERVKEFPNMEFRGEYRSPDDLPQLYGDVDLVWACYPPIQSNDWNLRWARTNRFYEGCLFQTPILSRAGCQDAKQVERYQIGTVIDIEQPEKVVETIGKITEADVQQWRTNMQKLPENVYCYTDELERLRDAIRQVANKGQRTADNESRLQRV